MMAAWGAILVRAEQTQQRARDRVTPQLEAAEAPRLVAEVDPHQLPEYHPNYVFRQMLDDGQYEDETYEMQFLFRSLAIWNDAPSGDLMTVARNVTSTIEIFDETGTSRLDEAHGHWQERDWPNAPKALVDLPPGKIDIPPDGSKHLLYVVVRVRFMGGPAHNPRRSYGCYVVREPRGLIYVLWNDRPPMTGPGRYQLHVTLRGDNLPPTMFRYKVEVADPAMDGGGMSEPQIHEL